MPQVYEVQYQINVQTEPALQAIQKFQEATLQLEHMARRFDVVSNSIGKLNSAFQSINKNGITVKLNTSEVDTQINNLLTKLKNLSNQKIPIAKITGLEEVQKSVLSVKTNIESINGSTITPKSNVTSAIGDLDKLLKKIEEVKGQSHIKITATASGASTAASQAAKQATPPPPPVPAVIPAPASTGSTTSTTGTTGQTTTTTPKPKPKVVRVPKPKAPSSGYSTHSLLGNVYASSGTNIMGEMVKGMGAAYALSSLFSGVGTIFRDATEYDNISKTTQNILATHDKGLNFNGRFNEMNALMRQVGVETKFTAPQVAEAGKFLAMAGLNIDEISSAIRPISSIALVGDTDLGETADVVTNIMTAYEIPAKKMSKVADVMTSTFTSSNVTLMEMAESFKYSATLFKKAEIPFEVAAASLGILGDAGIKGSQGGTTMRTILANIASPTKKQKEKWDKLGIARYDANGNLRDLPSIFVDLNSKNLNVSDFYGLFHKTAAQGAAALASSVEKWNQIISDNLISDNIASKLAKEKKNTIQGLWYQITSAFTESGMRGFESLQQPIRNMLVSVLEKIQTQEFTENLRNIMSLFIDMGGILFSFIDSLGKIYNIFKEFAFGDTLIKWYVRLQMFLSLWSGFLKMVISTKKSIISLSFMPLVGSALRWVTTLSMALKYLKAIHALNAINIGKSIFNPSSILGGTRGKAYARLMQSRKANPTFLAGSVLSSGVSAIPAPLLAIGAIAGSIAYVGYSFHQTSKYLEEYGNSIRRVNGIDMSEHASKADQYLQIVHNRQLSANQQLKEYIKLRREEMGLTNDALNKGKSFGEAYKDQLDQRLFSDFRSILGASLAMDDAFKFTKNTVAGLLPEHYRPEVKWKDGDHVSFLGSLYKRGDVDDANKLQIATTLFEHGASIKEGSEAHQIISEFTDRFLKAQSITEWNQVQNALNDKIAEIKGRSDDKYSNLSKDMIGNVTADTEKLTKQYNTGLIGQIEASFGYGGTHTANAIKLAQTKNLIEKYSLGLPVGEVDLQRWLYYSGIGAYNVENGLLNGTGSNDFFANQFGYSSEKGSFVGLSNLDPYKAAQDTKLLYDDTKNKISKLHPTVANLFSGFLGHKAWDSAKSLLSLFGDNKSTDDTIIPEIPTIPELTHNGNDESEYKSHYSNSAAPKQIIVRIENLMRVDNQTIDMTDDRQVAAVNSIKQELATALLDVVQDFNANIS